MKHRGFTLMEILVVLVIIGTLAGIGIPLARSMIAKSRSHFCCVLRRRKRTVSVSPTSRARWSSNSGR